MTQINKYKVFFTIFFVLISAVLFAGMPPSPPGGASPPSCWPPPCVPIDGGLGFLIAGGMLFGIKKALGFKRKKVE
jgi:hypothetical protein